ncbi:MAG: 4Fe-4S dicluster domain-containing protein [Pirellulales bacterium]|nr:4Fe-4S dicluster domain-containing protein [Pirellulales bacterium]
MARRLIRVLVFVAAVLVLLPQAESWQLAVVVPAASPLVAVASVLATRTLPWTACLGLAVGAIGLLRRRWFCRWACPVGLLADGATRIGLRLGRRCPHTPPLGQWIALAIIGGACLGYPVLLWLDPLALFSGPFSLLDAAPAKAAWWSAAAIAAVLLLGTLWPGSWCLRVCPLGATQDLLHRFCRWLRRTSARSAARPVSRQVDRGLPRRLVLGTLIGIGWAAAVRAVHARAAPCLRPPGALDETQFVGLCIRCGNCLRACPAEIIEPDRGQQGLAGLLAPVVEFREDYCREDCTRCAEACPSGALTPFGLEDKARVAIGLARVDMDVCLLGEARECSACRNYCPYEAIAYVWDEVQYTLTPRVNAERCPGCGACEVACPTTPTKAIRVHPC